MTGDATSGAQRRRWDELVERVAGMVSGAGSVVVRGDARTAPVAEDLAVRLRAATGRDGVRVAGGPVPEGAAELVIRLRRRAMAEESASEARADIVIDAHDPGWPVIRHVEPGVAGPESWYLAESRAFFAPRAATWGPARPAAPGTPSCSSPKRFPAERRASTSRRRRAGAAVPRRAG